MPIFVKRGNIFGVHRKYMGGMWEWETVCKVGKERSICTNKYVHERMRGRHGKKVVCGISGRAMHTYTRTHTQTHTLFQMPRNSLQTFQVYLRTILNCSFKHLYTARFLPLVGKKKSAKSD